MINQPQTYAPAMQPTPAPAQGPQFNAIKIDISGATVGTPAQAPIMIQQPVPQEGNVGQKVDYNA